LPSSSSRRDPRYDDPRSFQLSHRIARRRPVAAALVAAAALLVLVASPAAATSPGAVVVVPTTGEIDTSMASMLDHAIDDAVANQAAALVIELDTPGGSLDATQQIVGAILEAKVPVIVWVAPAGGFAASGGTFVTLAANLSYMAPGTRIGAASPIDASGQDITGTLGEKVKNDAIAYIMSIAETRHRPVDWAASTVSVARSSTALEAVSLGVVDGIAPTIESVVAQANGKTVSVAGADVTLDLANAPIEDVSQNPLQGFVNLLANPNIAFVLFVAGALALLFEVQNPSILVGFLGIVALVLSLVGFANLPTNIVGLILIGIGLGMFVLEPFIPSHGLLTIGGIIAVLLGGSVLFDQPGQLDQDVKVAVPILIVAAVSGALFGILITAFAIRTRRLRAPAGTQPASVPLGTVGKVHRPLTPRGSIRAVGEEWSARSADDQPIDRGTPVRVIGTEGLTVLVEPDPGALP
jgi:membrane-bound serine protease (ClpP class)